MINEFEKGDLVRFPYQKGKYVQGIVLNNDLIFLDMIEVCFYSDEGNATGFVNKSSVQIVQKKQD